MYRAHWRSVFRDSFHQTTLGVVVFEWTYFTANGENHGRRYCIETLGVDSRVSIIPHIEAAAFVREAGGHLHVTLQLPFLGPAPTEGNKTLNAPEAFHSVTFVANGPKVEIAPKDAWDHPMLRPAWGDVKLVFEDSEPVVEPAAL